MSQPQPDPPAVHPAGDQALTLEGLDRAEIGQPGELGLAERLAHGDQLQHGPLGISQVPQPQRDQLDQAGRGPQLTTKPPDAPSAASGPLSSAPVTISRKIIGLPMQRSAS